ncbi:MAG: DUF4234 domain-containing protein [Candidatus Nitrosocaldaceae archaeon]
MSDLQQRVNALLEESQTLGEDKYISSFLPFIPIITIVLQIIILIVLSPSNTPYFRIVGLEKSFISFPILFITYLIPLYLYYKWINGRNMHFNRVSKFYTLSTEIIEIMKLERAYIIKSRLNELTLDSNTKSVGVNIVLAALIPFYFLYIYHFMNKDMIRHSEKERLLLIEMIDSIKNRDPYFTKSILDHHEIKDRSTFIYIILSIITLGFFSIYWAYAITKDYNEHIRKDNLLTREINASLKRLNS